MLNWSNTFKKPAKQCALWKENIIGFESNSLNFNNINTNEKTNILLSGMIKFNNFQVIGSDFYFVVDKKISKFTFNSPKF